MNHEPKTKLFNTIRKPTRIRHDRIMKLSKQIYGLKQLRTMIISPITSPNNIDQVVFFQEVYRRNFHPKKKNSRSLTREKIPVPFVCYRECVSCLSDVFVTAR